MTDRQEPLVVDEGVRHAGPGRGPGPERNLKALGVLGAVLGLVVLGVILWQTAGTSDETAERVARGTSPAAGAQFPWEMATPPESLIPLEEIRSGGPPPDGIPPIDDPKFITASEADWLTDREPVISLVRGEEAKAYPLQVLTWHEIANDVVDGDPITVTFCPLCNSAVAFERTVETTPDAQAMLDGEDEALLDFGTSGRLYRSNLVMYDRQTKSLWIQFTGRSVTGPFIGTELAKVPVQIVSWKDMRTAHPDVQVLSRDTGHSRAYGQNPYQGYDDVGSSPFLFDGEVDGRLPAMDRVVTVTRGEQAVAYRYETLRDRSGDDGLAAINDAVGDRPLVVFYEVGTASALDAGSIAEGRDVGATGVFVPRSGDQELTFEVRDGAFVDTRTGSRWNVLGEAISGPLQGERLEGVHHDDTFWFVWSAFHPDTRVFGS